MADKPNRNRAFDFAQDVTKQLLTLSTAVITITISFADNLAERAPCDARSVLFISWGLFALSIVLGVFTLLNLTGRVENAEDAQSEGIYSGAVRAMSIGQIICFLLAFVGIVYFGARAF